MKVLLVLPILVPLLTAAISILLHRHIRLQRWLSVVSTLLLVGISLALLHTVQTHGILAMQAGNWPAPFGITLVADLLGAIMVVLAALTGCAVAVYSLGTIEPSYEKHGYHALLQVLLMGVCGAFVCGDIFNLYVWFEVMLIASFVLMGLGGHRAQMEGALKYVTLNLLSSAIFLAAVGILYGLVGTLNMADLSVKLAKIGPSGTITTVSMLFLLAFGIKAAAFPLFFWLPASYHTPPPAVSALFAGLLTKVGVYAMIRVFTLLFVHEPAYTHNLLLIISGLTMISGVLGAMIQQEFRRILSFHIVSQIGYMLMGLALFTPIGLAGSVFYLIHHILVKANLFLVSGVAYWLRGTYELKQLGGLYRDHPGVALLFLIPAMSLAGIPPLSGFFAKLGLVQAGLQIEQYAIVAVALAVSLLTLYSMTKIWAEAFWKADPLEASDATALLGHAGGQTPPRPGLGFMLLPIAVLAAMTVLIGLGAEPVFQLSLRAAEQLLDPAEYIRAVLN
jgi:multicomponent Na+:H+ antiporter subunit D